MALVGPSWKGPPEPRTMWRTVREYPRDVVRAAAVVTTLLPVLLLAAMGYARRWVTEDAFIDLRVTRHLLAGHGPVFNVGERVEAYTNPLWVALLTAWGALGGPLEVGSMALGLLLSIAGLLLAQVGAWRLGSRLHAAGDGGAGLPLPLGAAVFAAVPVVWDFATSGLETGLAIAWMGGVFWLLARSPRMTTRACRTAAFAIGCGPLVRPDLGLFSAGFGAALVLIARWAGERRPGGREWIRLGVIAATLPLGYQLFRMGYFAALVPNTALAKEASAAYWPQGWRYTLDFVGPYALWLPLLVAAAWVGALLAASRRHRDRPAAVLVLAPALSALGHWLYVTRVGGDFMHGRFLLPTLFAFLLPVATVVLPAGAVRTWRTAALAGVAAWAVVCALWLRVPYAGHGTPGPWGIADERGFYTYHMRMSNPIHIADYLRNPYVAEVRRGLLAHDRALLLQQGPGLAFVTALAPSMPPSIRVAFGVSNVGVLGYLAGADVHVIDRQGLSDPIGGRLLLEQRGRPGHEKLLPEAWLVARFGDPRAAAGRFPAIPEAVQALGCGDLARLLHAVTDPLTPARFLSNVRAAWRLHRLRIPADPVAARARLCGQTPAGS